MPVTIAIDPDADLITYTVQGDLLLDELRGALESQFDHPHFRKGMNAMWNLKEARIAVTTVELPELIAAIQGMSERRGTGFKVALLVRSNEDFGLSSIFEMSAYVLPFEVRVFRNTKEATEWVTGVKK
jgi:hypothetical protein